VSIGVAILCYRLWDIDLLINRALVYGALTASVIGIYVLVVGYLATLFQTSGNLLISLVGAGLAAVLFEPLRARLQRGANRLMYGDRDDPYGVLSRLTRRLDAAIAPEAVLPMIVETVAEALKLPYVAIALLNAERRTLNDEQADSAFSVQRSAFQVVVEVGEPPAQPLTLPLIYQGETIGRLILAPRQGESGFNRADRRLLADLARQAGVAARAVRLTADLQRSRERIVTAREEERRRIRRNLHDGLGSTLAALRLQADTASRLIASDPAAADALLLSLHGDLRAAITDVRRLAHELGQPALDGGGRG
jgi:signal transduction histidine kinase